MADQIPKLKLISYRTKSGCINISMVSNVDHDAHARVPVIRPCCAHAMIKVFNFICCTLFRAQWNVSHLFYRLYGMLHQYAAFLETVDESNRKNVCVIIKIGDYAYSITMGFSYRVDWPYRPLIASKSTYLAIIEAPKRLIFRCSVQKRPSCLMFGR